MKARERVLMAFAHQEPDRAPMWFGMSDRFIEKARRELGWEPQPVEESLRRAAAWFRERGWVGR